MKLTWKTAAKAMLDGEICVDKHGDKWKWDTQNFVYFNYPDSIWQRGDVERYGPYTIKKEPVKYSVDVWFTETPKADADAVFFMHYLFGRNIGWSAAPSEACNQKYRITVEEVE